MPIMVPCPKCGTNLSVPDDAAGKRVRCPKFGCGAIAEVPAFLAAEEVAVVDAVAVAPRPKPAPAWEPEKVDPPPRRRNHDDDDDDDDFDRPRRRKRRQSAGPSPGLIIAIAFGSILLVGGAGLGVYLLVSKKDATASNLGSGGNTGGGGLEDGAGRAKSAIPTGWVAYNSPSNSFKAYFPKHPAGTNASAGGNEVEMAILGGPRERLAVIVVALKLPREAAGINRDQLAEQMRQGVMKKQGRMRLVSQRTVTWLGRAALEMTLEQSDNKGGTLLLRQLTTDKYMYFAFFGDSTGPPKPDEANGFFDNFEIVN